MDNSYIIIYSGKIRMIYVIRVIKEAQSNCLEKRQKEENQQHNSRRNKK